jgi:hypothetical protein
MGDVLSGITDALKELARYKQKYGELDNPSKRNSADRPASGMSTRRRTATRTKDMHRDSIREGGSPGVGAVAGLGLIGVAKGHERGSKGSKGSSTGSEPLNTPS